MTTQDQIALDLRDNPLGLSDIDFVDVDEDVVNNSYDLVSYVGS